MSDPLHAQHATDPVSHAIKLMLHALEILDRTHPTAAASLSLAIEQAGGSAPPPKGETLPES